MIFIEFHKKYSGFFFAMGFVNRSCAFTALNVLCVSCSRHKREKAYLQLYLKHYFIFITKLVFLYKTFKYKILNFPKKKLLRV